MRRRNSFPMQLPICSFQSHHCSCTAAHRPCCCLLTWVGLDAGAGGAGGCPGIHQRQPLAAHEVGDDQSRGAALPGITVDQHGPAALASCGNGEKGGSTRFRVRGRGSDSTRGTHARRHRRAASFRCASGATHVAQAGAHRAEEVASTHLLLGHQRGAPPGTRSSPLGCL